jgi:3-methyl-2-oxobutanoate hydroxymethyltransferase
VSALGGYRVQGRAAQQAKKIMDDSKALEEAGAFAILYEMIPSRLSQLITERMETCFNISLGSGPHAHGQLLIYHDMFGLYPKFKPRMAKVFADAGKMITDGLKQYVEEVQEKEFPQPENWFSMSDEELDQLKKLIK